MNVLMPNPNLRYTFVDEHMVALNLERESYVLFEPVAATMWREFVENESRQGALARLGSTYATDDRRLADDYDAFIDRCVVNHYLVSKAPAVPECVTQDKLAPCRPRFLAFRAWHSLYVTCRDLRRHGFRPIYTQLRAPVIAGEREANLACRLRRAVRAFACAENFFHLRRAPADCLPRSLALFRYLRALSLPATHHIGVRLFPFMAHAWVSCRGSVLRDSSAYCASFQDLVRMQTWTTS